jgi:predicted phage terminase large subunit-like protein
MQGLRCLLADQLAASLAIFAQRAWPVIDAAEMEWCWFHDLICEYLTLARRRVVKRLIINLPPRCTKSLLVAVIFPAWVWATNPGCSFIFASYEAGLATTLSAKRRAILQSRWFQRLWPGRVVLTSDRVTEFENLAHGRMIATPIASATGHGGEFVILDDPLSPKEALSEAEREGRNRDFDHIWRTRLNDPRTGVFIIIQQRTHQDDLTGHLLATEPGVWTNVVLPMIAERDEVIRFPISGRTVHRREGDLLWRSRFSAEWCEREKLGMGSYAWASQMQQRPAPMGGGLFRHTWFRYYQEPPARFERVIEAWDTAAKVASRNDYSVGTCWGVTATGYYLLALVRGKFEYPELKRAVVRFYQEWRPSVVVVEDSSAGVAAVQELARETRIPIKAERVDRDKLSRAMAVAPLFEAGKVFFLQGAGFLPDLLDEFLSFDSGAHDDQVDSVVLALNHMQQQPSTLPLLEYFRKVDAGIWPSPFDPPRPEPPNPTVEKAEYGGMKCFFCGSGNVGGGPEWFQCADCSALWPAERHDPSATLQ